MRVLCSVLMMPCSNQWLQSSIYLNFSIKFVISNSGKYLSMKVRASGLNSLGDSVITTPCDVKTQLSFSAKLLSSGSKSSLKSTKAGKTNVSYRFTLYKTQHKTYEAPRHAAMLADWYVSVPNVTQWACNSFQMLHNSGWESADRQTDHSCVLLLLSPWCLQPSWYH